MFLFETKAPPLYSPSAGVRLLLIFFLMEFVIGPRLSLFAQLGFPVPPVWLRVPVLLGLVLILIRFFARLNIAQVGLSVWRDWNVTDTSYFVQVFLIANVVFCVLFANQLSMILSDTGLWGQAATAAITNLLWGFYQELVYRGILQTELVRRWGAVLGVLVANLLFTFGPLHFYHFAGGEPWRAWPMFAGIFLIGLFFGVLFRRSRNLWIVGVLHGLGNCYIDGLAPIGR